MDFENSKIFQIRLTLVHSVRGQSLFVFNLALMEKNMQFEFDLKLFVYSLVLNI